MKQLTGLDASFLNMETPNTFGHVTGLMLFDRPSPDFEPYATVYEKYASLVGQLEPMRRRLVEVPFGLDHPYWVFDPHFDIDYHIREINVAKPGLVDQLADQVCRIVGRPMDRSRPLWEVYVIDGLANGWWAMLTKFHHATIDGAAGQLMLSSVLSTEPDDTPAPASPEWEPEAVPGQTEMLRLTLEKLAKNPLMAVKAQTRMLRTMAKALGVADLSGASSLVRDSVYRFLGRPTTDRPWVMMPLTSAPPTPWNKSITPHRRFAMRTTSLENIKRLKNATGGTVNDIVMAICAGGLRQYLLAHDALPDKPLRAMVPVSIRTGDESDPWTNRVSGLIAELPTHCEDPLERVTLCRKAMSVAKQQFELMPAESLIDIAQSSPPVVSAAAARLASRLKLADRVAMPANLVISNVPGPREPLYFAGAQLQHQFPVSIVTDGQGLNITVQSYMDKLDFGFIVDRDLVPDVWDLADMHIEEIARLLQATGTDWAESPRAAPRRGPMQKVLEAKRASAKAKRKKVPGKKRPVAGKKATQRKKAVQKKKAAPKRKVAPRKKRSPG
jgi:WS/DGAT/MGAT family acyltransferase